MATGKVRIFELAKELGLSSKDLIGLFERLGLEAKNQLSVVDDPIADLVRGVLLGGSSNKGAAKAAAGGATAVAPPPPATATAPAKAPAAARPAAAAPAPAEPVPTLKRVTSAPRRTAKTAAATAAPVAPDSAAAASAANEPVVSEPVAEAPQPATGRKAVAAKSAASEAAPVSEAAVSPSEAPPASDEAVVAASAPEPGASALPASAIPAEEIAAQSSETETAAAIAPDNGLAGSGTGSARTASPGPRIVGTPRPRTAGSPAPRLVGSPPPRLVGSPPPRQAPAGNAPMPPKTRLPAAPVDNSPVPTLRPVPAGQSSIVAPRPPAPPAQPPANGIAASASPGPQTGMPGRPGVAPRPGQLGAPGQGYRPQVAPPPPQAGAPGAPVGRRPVGNGPFRPLTPPAGGAAGGGARPFTPRPPGAPGAPLTQGGPTPSSGGGGPRGPQGRGGDRDRNGAKKDRETEMLLEKERQRKKRGGSLEAPVASTTLETIEIPDVLTVQELATSMIIPAKDVIKELIKMGTMATINQNIPATVAQNVAKKFGFNAVIKEAGEEVVVEQEEDRPELLSTRPPVVTVLGHVDHGKTSLLDRIRSASVAAGEAGGITQRIGAYTVDRGDQKVTFIDTPGHEAFTAMRARGAKVTDVAILVVAADDGVMPQTLEAISHIKAAGVPIVVAINKMDKEDAQPDRVKSQLSEQGLQPVEWGGKTEMVPVSARTGEGIDQLLETVLLEAELRDLKANKTRRAQGVVIESALDKGRGAVATVLIQNGTLRAGDVVVVGSAFGKIRALVDDKGKQVKKAGPSIPVEIMGLSEVPSAGDTLMVVSDERVAREAAAKRSTRRKDVAIAATNGPRVSLETFMNTPADGARKNLNLILKADGQGAVEALRSRLEGLSNAEVDLRVIYAGVGAITPNDVNLASASNAVLIGFNIRPDETVKRLSENEQVDIRFYNVIYDVENDLKKAMLGMLAPKFREVILGRAEVREVFKVSKVGTIAGCYVQSGKLTRNAKVRILRDSAVVFESELESLRRFKDDVKEVAENFECGVQIAKFSDLKEGDVIEAFTSELVAPEAVPA
jgi:translation initiation factor IF-2